MALERISTRRPKTDRPRNPVPGRRWAGWLSLCLLACSPTGSLDRVRADVVVLANQAARPITGTIRGADINQPVSLGPGSVVPFDVAGPVELRYEVGGEAVAYELAANAAYFFAADPDQGLLLHRIDLGGAAAPSGPAASVPAQLAATAEIPVKLLVDDREPTTQAIWEPRLRQRLAAASDVLQRFCAVRLKVVAVSTWTCDEAAQDVRQGLVDFQHKVDPSPGRLAIGLTSLYRDQPGRFHLGGTQGLLRTHILIRERSPHMTEPERLEVLVHELGHYLGAVHSPVPRSVMRPLLADNQAVRSEFEIGFDPVNVLITRLVGQELRRGARTIGQFSEPTRQRLDQIYRALAEIDPDDNTAQQMRFQLALVASSPLAQATRQVLLQIAEAAGRLPPGGRPPAASGAERGAPDARTEFLVRRAAASAARQPGDVARPALLLGLGIALDASPTLLQNPLTREFCRAVETPAERELRRRAVGQPTVCGRHDLTQHFFLSAYLTAVAGPVAAETVGLTKELQDAKSGRGFSYVDLTADLAGIAFAQRLLDNQVSLTELAEEFTLSDHMPAVDGLPENLPWTTVQDQLVARGTDSLNGYRRSILGRIGQLPAARRGRSQVKLIPRSKNGYVP